MQILSIILLEHNLFENLIINSKININDGIIHEFIIYMINLCESEKLFTPINFLKKLKKISNKKFSSTKEIEPYKFYDFLLNQICKEMNYNFPNDENFFEGEHDISKVQEKLNKIYNNNIIIRTFFGIFEISMKCDYCNDSDVRLGKFNFFDFDIYDYICKETSCEKVELERCLKYYFEKEIKMDCKGCNKKKESKGTRKIVRLPDYLVIRLNWGEFNEEKGFTCIDEKIKPFYKYLDNIEYIEINKEFVSNNNQVSNGNTKYRLFGTVDYIPKEQKRFFCKFRTENNKWFVSWCNSAGKKVSTYKDDFSSPCLFFYKKDISS
jgi:ubiquitin C-terminal hydrolase